MLRQMDMRVSDKRKVEPFLAGSVYYISSTSPKWANVKDNIILLGGKVEVFFSNDVTTLLVEERCIRKFQSLVRNTVVNEVNGFKIGKNVSCCDNLSPPAHLHLLSPVSRGYVFLENSKVVPTSKNAIENSIFRLMQRAEHLGIMTVGIDQFAIWMEEKLRSIADNPKKNKRVQKIKLSKSFIKVEDIAKQYQTHYKIFQDPKKFLPLLSKVIRLNDKNYQVAIKNSDQSSYASSSSKRKNVVDNRKVKPKIIPEGQISPNVTVNTKSTKVKRKQTHFCECCSVHYNDLMQHIQGEKHQSFVSEDRNFECISEVIRSLPSVHQFIEKHNISAPVNLTMQDHSSVSCLDLRVVNVENATCRDKSECIERNAQDKSNFCEKPVRAFHAIGSANAVHSFDVTRDSRQSYLKNSEFQDQDTKIGKLKDDFKVEISNEISSVDFIDKINSGGEVEFDFNGDVDHLFDVFSSDKDVKSVLNLHPNNESRQNQSIEPEMKNISAEPSDSKAQQCVSVNSVLNIKDNIYRLSNFNNVLDGNKNEQNLEFLSTIAPHPTFSKIFSDNSNFVKYFPSVKNLEKPMEDSCLEGSSKQNNENSLSLGSDLSSDIKFLDAAFHEDQTDKNLSNLSGTKNCFSPVYLEKADVDINPNFLPLKDEQMFSSDSSDEENGQNVFIRNVLHIIEDDETKVNTSILKTEVGTKYNLSSLKFESKKDGIRKNSGEALISSLCMQNDALDMSKSKSSSLKDSEKISIKVDENKSKKQNNNSPVETVSVEKKLNAEIDSYNSDFCSINVTALNNAENNSELVNSETLCKMSVVKPDIKTLSSRNKIEATCKKGEIESIENNAELKSEESIFKMPDICLKRKDSMSESSGSFKKYSKPDHLERIGSLQSNSLEISMPVLSAFKKECDEENFVNKISKPALKTDPDINERDEPSLKINSDAASKFDEPSLKIDPKIILDSKLSPEKQNLIKDSSDVAKFIKSPVTCKKNAILEYYGAQKSDSNFTVNVDQSDVIKSCELKARNKSIEGASSVIQMTDSVENISEAVTKSKLSESEFCKMPDIKPEIVKADLNFLNDVKPDSIIAENVVQTDTSDIKSLKIASHEIETSGLALKNECNDKVFFTKGELGSKDFVHSDVVDMKKPSIKDNADNLTSASCKEGAIKSEQNILFASTKAAIKRTSVSGNKKQLSKMLKLGRNHIKRETFFSLKSRYSPKQLKPRERLKKYRVFHSKSATQFKYVLSVPENTVKQRNARRTRKCASVTIKKVEEKLAVPRNNPASSNAHVSEPQKTEPTWSVNIVPGDTIRLKFVCSRPDKIKTVIKKCKIYSSTESYSDN